MVLICVEKLTKHFPIQSGFMKRTTGYVRALTDVTFTIEKGQVLGVVGESGSGKSTLARVLMKLMLPTSGTILFDGIEVTKSSKAELMLLRKRMQIVFQNPAQSLNPRKTISDILREPLEFHHIVEPIKLYHHIEELLEIVGLPFEMASRYPHELSIGQQQRVAIARAISVKPDFLILDECVSALDISVQAQILNLLQDLQNEFHMTYLFISHDLNVVEHLADTIIVMKEGSIVEEGDADKLFRYPKHSYTKKLLASTLSNHPLSRTCK